jgi:hypothetical protein
MYGGEALLGPVYFRKRHPREDDLMKKSGLLFAFLSFWGLALASPAVVWGQQTTGSRPPALHPALDPRLVPTDASGTSTHEALEANVPARVEELELIAWEARSTQPWVRGALKGALIGGLITGTATVLYTELTTESRGDGWGILTWPFIFGYAAVPGALVGGLIGGVRASSSSR